MCFVQRMRSLAIMARAAHPGGLFEKRQKILHRADFLFQNQDQAVLEHALHPIRIRISQDDSCTQLHTSSLASPAQSSQMKEEHMHEKAKEIQAYDTITPNVPIDL